MIRARIWALAVLSAIVGVAAFVVPSPSSAAAVPCSSLTTPVYHRVNPTSSVTLLTTSAQEAQDAAQQGFTQDLGIAFRASSVPDAELVAIHKLRKPNTGNQVWIPAGPELNSAVANGYEDLGVAFYAPLTEGTGCIGVYRFQNGGYHAVATTTARRIELTDAGWTNEGIRYYGAAGDPAADTEFSIAVIPDTQNETIGSNTDRFRGRTQWLVDHRAELDLRFVGHSGDVWNWGWLVPEQQAVASGAMIPLEQAGIPYALAIGNHDTRAVGWNGVPGSREYGGAAYASNPECPERFSPTECDSKKLVRHTEEFNNVFTASRYRNVAGAYAPGAVDNIYSTFTAGGKQWLVLTLEIWPRDGAINWAKSVVQAHPAHNVIVQTHAYLNADGSISSSNGGYGANSPQYVYDNLIKLYPNIKMVFSGHTGQAAHRQDTGVNGNKIYSFLQTFHSSTNPVRLVEIDTSAGTVDTRIFAPETGNTYPDYVQHLTGMDWVG